MKLAVRDFVDPEQIKKPQEATLSRDVMQEQCSDCYACTVHEWPEHGSCPRGPGTVQGVA